MTLSLHNKQLLLLLAVALLTVLALVAFVAASVAHVNLFEALKATPSVFVPWF